MSTVTEPKPTSPTPPDDDPFRYGWRFVRKTNSDGTERRVQVPLTLEDLLHPEEEDFRVHSDEHGDDCMYLKAALRRAIPAGYRVLSDHRVTWGIPDLGAHGPDVIVFRDAGKLVRGGSTYDLAVEPGRPVLAVEVVSPDSRVNDVEHKLEEYHKAGIPIYIIVDTKYRRRGSGGPEDRIWARLMGYRWTPQGYEPMEPDQRGWLWIEPLQLWIGLKRVMVRLYDMHGQEIEDYLGLAAAHQAVAANLEAEAMARADAERMAAQAERMAAEEARARSAAEEKLRSLEAELQRLRGQDSSSSS